MIRIETVLRVNGSLMTCKDAEEKALNGLGEWVDHINKQDIKIIHPGSAKTETRKLNLDYWQMVALTYALVEHGNELLAALKERIEIIEAIATCAEIDQ